MDPTVTSGGDVDIPLTDLYSNWKDDITLSDNFTYDFAYRVIGGEPTYATNSISINVFQDNGWKLRPREINHTGRITGGNLIPESGGAILPTVGTYTALVEYQNPERSIAVTSGGLVTTVAEVADAVWDELKGGHITADSYGKIIQDLEVLIEELHRVRGLKLGTPATQTTTQLTAGDITIAVTGDGEETSTFTRQP